MKFLLDLHKKILKHKKMNKMKIKRISKKKKEQIQAILIFKLLLQKIIKGFHLIAHIKKGRYILNYKESYNLSSKYLR